MHSGNVSEEMYKRFPGENSHFTSGGTTRIKKLNNFRKMCAELSNFIRYTSGSGFRVLFSADILNCRDSSILIHLYEHPPSTHNTLLTTIKPIYRNYIQHNFRRWMTRWLGHSSTWDTESVEYFDSTVGTDTHFNLTVGTHKIFSTCNKFFFSQF